VHPQILTRELDLRSHLATAAARTIEPVADNARDFAAGEITVSANPDRDDAGAMEHERQARLRRWASQP